LFMNGLFVRALKIAMLMGLPLAAAAQTSQPAGSLSPAGTLSVAGQTDQAPLVRIDGKSYVDIDSLARITHGSLRFQGSQTILTLAGAAGAAGAAAPAAKVPQFSAGFLSAEIEALTQIREWHAALVNAIENNYPVSETWVGRLRRTADSKLDLAVVAATTEPDQKALELLRSEFANMQAESDQFVAMHANATYIPPDSFDNNAQDQKILTCEHALISIAATKVFDDVAACH
jgi:hypothetical protein